MMNNDEKYLGIDWGGARIGLAIAEAETGLALPRGVVSNIAEIKEIVAQEEIDRIILGAPFKMSGSDELNKEFLDFFRKLQEEIRVPIQLHDERLSSLAGDSLVGNKKDKAPRDAVAAMLILQNYLDSQNF